MKGGLPRRGEAIPRTGVLFTEGGLVKQDHRHRKVGPNRADAEHGVSRELDLVVIHVLPCVRCPGREIAHVQDVAGAIFRGGVCAAAAAWIAARPGWQVTGITTSPIPGPQGNVEFLLGAVRD